MDNDLREKMGMRMRARRKELSYTQEQMAEILNISVKHYGGVERGDAGLSLENLVCLCETLSVSLDYIVLGEKKADDESSYAVPPCIVEIFSTSSISRQKKLIQIIELMNKL